MDNYLQSLLPTNDEEKLIVSTEMLVLSVQVALQKAMTKRGVTNSELAARLGMSVARVSQIFSERGPNLTLKTIARVAAALGEDFEFLPRSEAAVKSLLGPLPLTVAASWHESRAANDQHVPQAQASRLRTKMDFRNKRIWADGSLERRAA